MRVTALVLACAGLLAACAGAEPGPQPQESASGGGGAQSWEQVMEEARGQTVDLWMYGGDQKGNTYVDEVLAPAAAELGVTLRRVPVADTADALNRVLSELQAGRRDSGSVDLVWVNGENFRSGQQAGAWLCGWTSQLPNMRYTDPADPLLSSDFGTPVQGCEAPWHKAQFVLAYDSADVTDPPRSVEELFAWARQHPGRFTYPAPPDFTGSAFLRQALYASAGGQGEVPADYDEAAFNELTPALYQQLLDVAPSLWRSGQTYPRDLAQLEDLYASDQVDITMTYGPATLEDAVARGVFPASTRVLGLEGGTLGNASFLAVPVNAGDRAAAQVVADLALSPQQQLAKARPEVWGQYTVLDQDRLPEQVRQDFAALPTSQVVPSFAELSRGALPELGAGWVAPLEDGWRTTVLPGR
ncbi:ABC transporter substrate-binding protein [Quadrisphaera oryzae]|uniref:ABC transporter substrate-binding protein n=1 Tax=Quadrisphaera TaxID=317661 RepID=UPI00351C45AB